MEDNKKFIDFNIDLAQILSDTVDDKAFELIDLVSSVNVSCGFHAGTPIAIKNAIAHCKHKEKVIGAHISLPQNISIDSINSLSDDDIEAIVLYQLGALSAFAKAESLNVEYVRPHGLMYKLMNYNLEFSLKVAKSIKKFSEWFVLYGPTGSVLKEVSSLVNINVAQEVQLTHPYLVGAKIDFDSNTLLENGLSLIRLRRLCNLSELELSDGSFEKVEFDTVHFSTNLTNVSDLLSEANKIFIPRPVNYNNVVASGWV